MKKTFALILLAVCFLATPCMANPPLAELDQKNFSDLIAVSESIRTYGTFARLVKFKSDWEIPSDVHQEYRFLLIHPNALISKEFQLYYEFAEQFKYTKSRKVKAGSRWVVVYLPKVIGDDFYLRRWILRPLMERDAKPARPNSGWLFPRKEKGTGVYAVDQIVYASASIYGINDAKDWLLGKPQATENGFKFKLISAWTAPREFAVPGIESLTINGEKITQSKEFKSSQTLTMEIKLSFPLPPEWE